MDEVPLLPKLPALTKEHELENLVKNSRRPASKMYDFFILYCTKGIDGNPLPDAAFAEQLIIRLENEKMMSGRKISAVWGNENDENPEEVLKRMSKSLVVLVVFSEAALQTFAGDAHQFKQNNYLLYLQFAMKLHDAKGVRILGLNMVAVENDELQAYIKFQGWCVRFNDVLHYSEWIQESISKTMQRVFAIQGIGIDTEEWEYKLPTLLTTLYTMQDEINATQWISTLKILPWKSVCGLMLTFVWCFINPVFGYCLLRACVRCSKKNRDSYLNVGLFGSGIMFLFLGVGGLAACVLVSAKGALCASDIKCQVLVQAGNRWALWRDYAEVCKCYDDDANPYHFWVPQFNSTCAECVCLKFKDPSEYLYSEHSQKECNNSAGIFWGVITGILFLIGFIMLFTSLKRLMKQAIATKKVVKATGSDVEMNDLKGKQALIHV